MQRFLGASRRHGKLLGLDTGGPTASSSRSATTARASSATSSRRRRWLPRGVNNLWNKGGLMYAPPMR